MRSAGILGDVPPTMYFMQAQSGRSAYYVPTTLHFSKVDLALHSEGRSFAASSRLLLSRATDVSRRC